MPPIGTRTVFVEEISNSGRPVQKFGRTNMYANKVVHTVGVSQNSDKYDVVQLVQNAEGHMYKRAFVLPEMEIMKLMSMPDVLVPIESADAEKRTRRTTASKKTVKKTVPKKKKTTTKKVVKKTVSKKTTTKKVVKKTVPKKTATKKVVKKTSKKVTKKA